MTSTAFEMLEVGLTKQGKPFYIPRFHTLIAGASGAGKTEAARKIVSALRKMIPDLKVLIFDVKSTGRDWKGYGMDVPIYVETATDSRFLRDLIETQERRKIDWFFYELHMATQATKTWQDVLKNLQTRYKKYRDKNQMKEEKLGTLIIYMEALVSELDKGDMTSKFNLSQPITVVPLNYREDAFKQLVVYSYLTAMKRNQVKRVLIVCDEMSTLAPSMSGTGCKRIIEQYLFKQGRAAEVFGLAIDQEITGISPSVRRQCWNWILGMQTDVSAQERTIEQIPGKKLTLDDISTLGVGWWEAVIRTPSSTEVEKFYLIPDGVSDEIGRKIVSGEMKVEEVMHSLRVTQKEDENMDKELEEKLRAEIRSREIERDSLKDDLKNNQKELEGLKIMVNTLKESNKTLMDEVTMRDDAMKALDMLKALLGGGVPADYIDLKKKVEQSLHDLGMRLSDIALKIENFQIPGFAASVSIAEIDERINQRLAGPETARIVTVDVDARIKELAKNHILSNVVAKIRELNDPSKKAAWWLHEKKRASVKELYNYVYNKSEVGGRIPGNFYANVVNPLEDAWLVKHAGATLTWNLQEKIAAELKEVLTAEDLEKVPKYLASLLL